MARHPHRKPDVEHIAIEIAGLRNLDGTALRLAWREATGKAAAPGLKGDLLVRAVAYALQEQAYGGLSVVASKRLEALARTTDGPAGTGTSVKAPNRRRLMPGARLVRAWQGVPHEVIVIPDGFLWQGQTYTSLSSVAKAITGKSWNGWVFFGAKPKFGKAPLQQAGTQRTAPDARCVEGAVVREGAVDA